MKPMRRPGTRCVISRSLKSRRFSSSSRISPLSMVAVLGTMPRMARASVDLP
jgi:hypothetical protein